MKSQEMATPLEPNDSALLMFDFPFPQLIDTNSPDATSFSAQGLWNMNLVLYPDSTAPLFELPKIAFESDETFSKQAAGVIRLIAYNHAYKKFVDFAQHHNIEAPSYLYPYMALISHVGRDTATDIINESQWYFDEKFELIENIKMIKRALMMNANASIYGRPTYMMYFAKSVRYKRVMGCTVS